MTQSFSAELDPSDGTSLRLALRGIPAAAIGRNGTVSLRARVDVKRSNGIDVNESIVEQSVRIAATTMQVTFASPPPQHYTFTGKHIDIRIVARLEIDDGLVFDTTLESAVSVPSRSLHPDAERRAAWIEPTDQYSLTANLRALSPGDRVLVRLLLGVAGLVGGGNVVLGLHDQWVPEAETVWYDHHGSKGSESPALKSLAGSAFLSGGLWLAIRARLRRYMRIELAPGIATPRRGRSLRMKDVVKGAARVPLERSTLRVVAANRELGRYREKSGKETKTRSFHEPVQSVVLYEQFLAHVPAQCPLADYLPGDIDFEPVFTNLLPPFLVGDGHGIDVVWEVQLLHPEFVDQEVQGPSDWHPNDWSSITHDTNETA